MTLPKIFGVQKPDHGNPAPIAPHNPSASARHSIKPRWVRVNNQSWALHEVERRAKKALGAAQD